jgi:hypothetical protein
VVFCDDVADGLQHQTQQSTTQDTRDKFLVNAEPKETVKQATINQTRVGINLQNLFLSCVD